MNESPVKRFRHIITTWRKQRREKQDSAVTLRETPRRAVRHTPRSVPPPSRPVQPAVKPDQPAPVQARQPVRTKPKARPSVPPKPAVPSTSAAQRRVAAKPTARRAKPPGRVQQAASPPTSSNGASVWPTLVLDKFKTPADARRFLERLRAKTTRLVQDFSDGAINQRQFQVVYSHYQRQRMAVEMALIETPGSGAWRVAAVEGHTSFLREQHAAQVLSYAIYETASGLPVTHVGDFSVDNALLVPMLSTFRSSTEELFGAGMKRIELEGGHWLCYVPGRYTSLIVVFSAEPAAIQLQTIEDLHRDFEIVNRSSLSSGDLSHLALTFTHLWAFE